MKGCQYASFLPAKLPGLITDGFSYSTKARFRHTNGFLWWRCSFFPVFHVVVSEKFRENVLVECRTRISVNLSPVSHTNLSVSRTGNRQSDRKESINTSFGVRSIKQSIISWLIHSPLPKLSAHRIPHDHTYPLKIELHSCQFMFWIPRTGKRDLTGSFRCICTQFCAGRVIDHNECVKVSKHNTRYW